MPVVYVPSIPTRYDAATDRRIPAINLNPAAEYGPVTQLVESPEALSDLPASLITLRERSLAIRPEDYVVAAGDIILVAAVLAHACERNGSVRVLRWDKHRRTYDVVEVKL